MKNYEFDMAFRQVIRAHLLKFYADGDGDEGGG